MTNDRKHITVREVEKLMAATKGSRFEARDRCLLLMMFLHGLRVSEACAFQVEQVDTEYSRRFLTGTPYSVQVPPQMPHGSMR
ncbi:MAG: tyrosine-type recombinase/integrase [Syntrophobacteraceae bacterium]|jgi:integrase